MHLMRIADPKAQLLLFFTLCFLCLNLSCDKETLEPAGDPSVQAAQVSSESELPEVEVSTPDPCVDTYRPVVVVHGFLASGDTYATQFQRFTSNGYCNNALYAFDWNSAAFGADQSSALSDFIDIVISKTGSSQVDLVGHSAGGGVCYGYLESATNAAKVAHYVHIGSSSQSQPPGPNGEVSTLNISSTDDATTGTSNVSGAENLTLSGYDHYQVATCSETFSAMYEHFNQELPTTAEIVSESFIAICGKALTLGENAPLQSAVIEIYEVSPATGQRVNTQADHILQTNANGYWGPVSVDAGVPYEFVVDSGLSGDRVVHYYREGFQRSNALVYLRTLPPATSLAGLLLAGLPSDDTQAVVGLFASSQAVISGRDDLMLNEYDLSVPEFTSADQTTIAMFLYDDGDSNSSLDPVPTFTGIQFLNGADLFIPGDPTATVTASLNGRTIRCPAWPSASDGLIVIVFD